MAQFRSPIPVYSFNNEEAHLGLKTPVVDCLTLCASDHGLAIFVRLPSTALMGDSISATLTLAQQRQPAFSLEHTLSYLDIESKVISLTLAPAFAPLENTPLDDATLMLNIHGKHHMIKDSTTFSVNLDPHTVVHTRTTRIKKKPNYFAQLIEKLTKPH